jgi:hypothetical protein
MDKSTHIPGAKEFYGKAITAQEMTEQALLVMDRVTGEMYNPKEAFDRLMNTPEVLASLKRLAVR